MIAAALVLVAAGMMLVRLGWGARRAVSLVGWAAASGGVVGATVIAGAWGCTVAMLVGTTAALVAIAWAGWRSPVRVRRAPRVAPAASVPVRLANLGRRAAVFVLVVPGAFVAAQGVALAARQFVLGHGGATADATVVAWMVQPLAWGIVMTVQMTRAAPAAMVAPPLAAGALGAVLWWAS